VVTSPGWKEKTHFGWGVGGSVLLPVIPKFLDLQGSVLTGQGLGRYGSSQLADVTIGPDGTLQPLRTTQILLGAIAHPWAGFDLYGYAGQEQVSANFWSQKVGAAPTVQGGYGNPAYLDGGCFNPAATAGGTGSAGFARRRSRLVSGSSSIRGIWGNSGPACSMSSSGCKHSLVQPRRWHRGRRPPARRRTRA
jgi:hypothetical protein